MEGSPSIRAPRTLFRKMLWPSLLGVSSEMDGAGSVLPKLDLNDAERKIRLEVASESPIPWVNTDPPPGCYPRCPNFGADIL